MHPFENKKDKKLGWLVLSGINEKKIFSENLSPENEKIQSPTKHYPPHI